MKKVISIILAVMMLASICVPCFATDITKDTPAPQTAAPDVKTKLTKTDGTDAYTYTVTIPASVEVAWGDTTAQDAKYTVTSQLKLGDTLKVKAEANDGGKMTNAGTASIHSC